MEMKSNDYRREIDLLLTKAPDASKISTIQTASNFKNICISAKKAKSLKDLSDTYNQLRSFYKWPL